jgi:preprotein translocase subunit SecD
VKNVAENTKTEQVVLSKKQYEMLLSENEYLKQQLNELKRLIFGSRSERFIPTDDSQLSLFDIEKKKEEAQTQEISYLRKKADKEKQQAIRAKIPAHLPRVEEVVEPENIEEGSKKIGEEITEVLEYNPARVYMQNPITMELL